MRNLTLSIIALGACFLVFTNVQAQAGVCPDAVCFDFELGHDTSDQVEIGNYMTGLYGPTVTVANSKVMNNWKYLPLPWIGKASDDYYLATQGKEMEITFEKPITNVCGDGRVFFSIFQSPDFTIAGYDGLNLIDSYSDNVCIAGNVEFDLAFATPVDRLKIYGNCIGVAVDDLCVQPVPVPGAGLLSILGIGITGWLKRRNTL
ncbi:MAG: hypothetical protein K9M75_01510 [Phycisphaerae bacterium]|nr:hypothetical protein [Phycisphaerae bacterium]